MSDALNLTNEEWHSLGQLVKALHQPIPAMHKSKLIKLGVAAEKAGYTVITFEGKLALHQHRQAL